MKDQQIEKAMDGIENRIRHIYNCGYQQGYEDGKNSYGTEIRTKQDVNEAYQHGYEDGRKAYMVDTIKQSDFSYQKGLEDAWECAKKLVSETSKDVLIIHSFNNHTIQQAMQTIKEYEERQTEKTTICQKEAYDKVLAYLKENVDDFPDYHEAIEAVLKMKGGE